MSQERLTNLAIVSIEHEISNKLEMSKLIKQFSEIKAKRRCFV